MRFFELDKLKIRQRRLQMDNKVNLAALTEEERMLTTTQRMLDPVAGNATPTVLTRLTMSKILSNLKYAFQM